MPSNPLPDLPTGNHPLSPADRFELRDRCVEFLPFLHDQKARFLQKSDTTALLVRVNAAIEAVNALAVAYRD